MSFALGYICLIAVFMFVMLFGECAAFEGTLIARAHGLLTGGLCDFGVAGITRVCGERGRRLVDAATTQCCDRPNPALQARVGLAAAACAALRFSCAGFPRRRRLRVRCRR